MGNGKTECNRVFGLIPNDLPMICKYNCLSSTISNRIT